jgi:hypothetical protein
MAGEVDGGGARGSAWSDRQCWLAIGAALFVLAAWPLLLVELPPLQDLPNHVASAYIVHHLDRYPDYVFNGFWKSNSLLARWLDLWPDRDLWCGARIFVAFVLAANAFGLPWFVLQVAGRRAMVTASLVIWPLVHGFFLAMGMLNFAIAIPLSLVVLVALDRQRARPSLALACAITALAFATWYVHPFPLIVAGGLAALAWIEARRRGGPGGGVRAAVAMLLPLAPIAALVVATTVQHLVKVEGAPVATGLDVVLPASWEVPLDLWLHASGALTRWGSVTVIPAIALPILTWRRAAPPILARWASLALVAGYAGLPLMISNWWYLNARLVPFVWIALAIRMPPRVPRWLIAVLAGAALWFSVVLGIDYVRLDRDRAELTAGIAAVPERATLLPLLFRHRKTSDYTASLTHAWAYYVVAKQTSAPLAFAVERSYPITYRVFPPAALIPPALDGFAERHASPAVACASRDDLGRRPDDCAAAWQLAWSQLWRAAEPRFTHVLTWAMPAEARALMPPSYHLVFSAGDLAIYARPAGPPPRY